MGRFNWVIWVMARLKKSARVLLLISLAYHCQPGQMMIAPP
jgi:hypothetical protein